MELQKLIREIHWLEWQLRAFEDKYGVLSADFYQAFQSGELSEFDDTDLPQFYDFLEWSSLYKVSLHREQRYRAPGLSFTEPNLPFLIREVEQMLENE